MSDDGLAMLHSLVLEDGRTWSEAACREQIADAEAIFAVGHPHRHFVTRPRGGSKTTDIAGVALAWLAMEAPPRSNGRVVASSVDQAAILIDAAAGFISRTPELDGVIVPESERLVGPNGAWVKVLSQSDSGSWGLRDCHLLVCDEFAQWPETRAARRVYTAIRTTVQKTPGCRLIILTSAGEPSHWSHEVLEQAKTDPLWRVSEMPGPVPWQDPAELESLRRELRRSEYERLILNVWSEDEDRAISPEDYDLAAQSYTTLAPRPGVKYVITVDVGIRNDATVMCVAHREPVDDQAPHGPQRVVVDHLERWQGSKRRPVQVSDIEDWLVKTAPRYNRADVYADPDQFVGNVQSLNRRGVRAQEWAFTATSVGQVATALVQAFRSRQITVPHSQTLKDELLRVRLRETAPGVTRLDHDRGAHDDQAVAVGMAAHILLGGKMWGAGQAFLSAYKAMSESKPPDRPVRPRSFMVGDEPPPALNPAACRKPRFFDGRCVHCGIPVADHRPAA